MAQKERITIKDLNKNWMEEIIGTLHQDITYLQENYFRLKGEQFLAYELLSQIFHRNNKVFAHHHTTHSYNFIVTKGEAWFLVFWYYKKSQPNEPITFLIHKLHQKIV